MIVKIKIREGLDVRLNNIVHVLRDLNTPVEIVSEVENIYKSMKNEMLDAREALVQKDYDLENAKNQIQSLTWQNRHMKTLLMEEWRQHNEKEVTL